MDVYIKHLEKLFGVSSKDKMVQAGMQASKENQQSNLAAELSIASEYSDICIVYMFTHSMRCVRLRSNMNIIYVFV